jgi:hypothetical protein
VANAPADAAEAFNDKDHLCARIDANGLVRSPPDEDGPLAQR